MRDFDYAYAWIVVLYEAKSQNEDNVYLATWEGDPGRTHRLSSARQFSTERAAKQALLRTRRNNPHRDLSQACVHKVGITLHYPYPPVFLSKEQTAEFYKNAITKQLGVEP